MDGNKIDGIKKEPHPERERSEQSKDALSSSRAAIDASPALLGEAGDLVGDRLGLFDLRVMRRADDSREAGGRQASGELLAIGGGDNAVLGAPQHQARHRDPVQPMR